MNQLVGVATETEPAAGEAAGGGDGAVVVPGDKTGLREYTKEKNWSLNIVFIEEN